MNTTGRELENSEQVILTKLVTFYGRKINIISLLTILLILASACEEPIYTPKPRTYPKVEFPTRGFQTFNNINCPFSFDYPVYAQIEKNPEASTSDCWFDVYIPAFDSRLYCTYYSIESQSSFEKLWTDAFELANKHNVRADYIDPQPIQKNGRTIGFTFDIEGASASPYQFFITDSTQHFLRASLYFNTQTNRDSLAPIFAFLKEDFQTIIKTFAWKEEGSHEPTTIN